MKSNINIIIIHDDIKPKSFLITKLEEHFENVILIDNPKDGIKYVSEHYSEKMIIVLDINFGEEIDGYEVLEKIRDYSYLIEVIILSAEDLPGTEMIENVNKLFGFDTFDYIIRKPKNQDKLIGSILRAKEKIDNSISSAIDKWIEVRDRDRRNKPYIIDHEGKSYTLDDIKKEINMQTPEGMQIEKNITMLAIKLMMDSSQKK